jgi:hypothetical protein
MTMIRVNPEAMESEWWLHAHRVAGQLSPEALKAFEALTRVEAIEVRPRVAIELYKWASSLPAWDEPGVYEDSPLLFAADLRLDRG